MLMGVCRSASMCEMWWRLPWTRLAALWMQGRWLQCQGQHACCTISQLLSVPIRVYYHRNVYPTEGASSQKRLGAFICWTHVLNDCNFLAVVIPSITCRYARLLKDHSCEHTALLRGVCAEMGRFNRRSLTWPRGTPHSCMSTLLPAICMCYFRSELEATSAEKGAAFYLKRRKGTPLMHKDALSSIGDT